MRKIYPDSSAYVKVFAQEPGTETIDLLFQLAFEKRIQILLSEWAINECLSAIDRKHRKGEVTEQQKKMIIATLFQRAISWSEKSSEIAFVPLHPVIIDKSRDFILHLHISSDDALHIYTAYFKRCECVILNDDKLKRVPMALFQI